MFRHLLIPFLALASARAELRVPGCTAYGAPNFDAIRLDKERGVMVKPNSKQTIVWFGEINKAGKLDAAVNVSLPPGGSVDLELAAAGKSLKGECKSSGGEGLKKLGSIEIAQPGYVKFTLEVSTATGCDIKDLILDGPAAEGAHFNTGPRRNAASVHLSYPVPDKSEVQAFYCEVTGVEDPVYTYYMAAGFSRGYFGMQVNSPKERRIIFSVWDAAEGGGAKDRSTVKEENHTQLLAKGEGVEASVFGNEGTGGHSHLVYPWKTGETQKFVVRAMPVGTFTDYSGYWFHPDRKAWMLIAGFRAPKDGKYLRGLYSFSENFGGSNGHLLRKASYGNQWIQSKDGQWTELLKASFSHDGTGKTARLDRFMGVENGQFFLSHGGFVPGFTKYGESFTRPATGKAPVLDLPKP